MMSIKGTYNIKMKIEIQSFVNNGIVNFSNSLAPEKTVIDPENILPKTECSKATNITTDLITFGKSFENIMSKEISTNLQPSNSVHLVENMQTIDFNKFNRWSSVFYSRMSEESPLSSLYDNLQKKFEFKTCQVVFDSTRTPLFSNIIFSLVTGREKVLVVAFSQKNCIALYHPQQIISANNAVNSDFRIAFGDSTSLSEKFGPNSTALRDNKLGTTWFNNGNILIKIGDVFELTESKGCRFTSFNDLVVPQQNIDFAFAADKIVIVQCLDYFDLVHLVINCSILIEFMW
ncbi:hypothetical protein EIN_411330 [Entamoeba invadens IP1]|uniref:Uncharacterized protein n=1 Tax=Entamoeba invadens IP1 TaxID=370355 RepID=A0A0A1U195_ENTIV|nr:hypothetical protein EIN_411330 [Entamoeba invadens IP1]ELP87780.1 hypothetical protein EIN_411330 [Entamoeba invadens IP1]|eukprot:XP_004254551.1 hypothetical protein EIN_411330 [Entamoeba invadens IP1]